MLTQEALVESGYKRFPNPLPSRLDPEFNQYGYQKRVSDEKGIRYFIDVIQYNWKNVPGYPGAQLTYEPEVHLYTSDCAALIRVIVLNDAHCASVEALEAYVDQLWRQTGAGYYERFNNE
jgi:hypothetical protein